MSAAFTKGPWVVDEKANPYSPPGLVISAQDAVIAEVLGEDDIDDEVKANARLIAAAPELYEAAQLALESMRTAGNVHDGDIHAGDPAVSALETALAKARGDQ